VLVTFCAPVSLGGGDRGSLVSCSDLGEFELLRLSDEGRLDDAALLVEQHLDLRALAVAELGAVFDQAVQAQKA
jgi:hypothetical protein